MPNNKTEIFDFCETLVDVQSADLFIDYLLENGYLKKRGTRLKIGKMILNLMKRLKIMSVVYKVYPKSNFWEKNLRINSLKGLDVNDLDEVLDKFCDVLRSHIIKETWDALLEAVEKNRNVIIISAGYGIYLREFFKVYPNISIIASELEVSNSSFTGRLSGLDCFGLEKVNRLSQIFSIDDLRPIRVFSDSVTDLPILELADEAIVVSSGKIHNWAREKGFNSIVY